MNVLYLHQHFATRAGAGGTRSYEFARHLLSHGHTVTMVTGQRQGGGISNAKRQQVDGIEIISLGGWYSNRMGPRKRILSFLRFTLLACRLRQLPHKPDVVIASSTPLTVGLPGAVLARRFDAPFVFEVRDLWPQAPVELGALKNPVAIRVARWLERWLYRRADSIIALSPGMKEGVLARGTDEAKVITIPNACDTDLFGPAHRDRTLLDRWNIAERFVAVHGGSMGRANGLRYVLEAAQLLQDQGEQDIHVLFVGDGGTRPELEAEARQRGLNNVTFAGSLPRAELGAVVSSCDASITSFAPLPVLATNSPNKLFDGLAAGVPVIVNSPGWTRQLVEDFDTGVYVNGGEPAQLAAALVKLKASPDEAQRLGKNARALAEGPFQRELLAARFRTVLESARAGELPGPDAWPPASNDDAEGAAAAAAKPVATA